MIVKVCNNGKYHSFQSNGCGCCSIEYYPNPDYWKEQEEWGKFPFDDKTPEQVAQENYQRILDNLRQNIKVTKESCEALGLDFQTLIDES